MESQDIAPAANGSRGGMWKLGVVVCMALLVVAAIGLMAGLGLAEAPAPATAESRLSDSGLRFTQVQTPIQTEPESSEGRRKNCPKRDGEQAPTENTSLDAI